jgi:hypothetical protein
MREMIFNSNPCCNSTDFEFLCENCQALALAQNSDPLEIAGHMELIVNGGQLTLKDPKDNYDEYPKRPYRKERDGRGEKSIPSFDRSPQTATGDNESVDDEYDQEEIREDDHGTGRQSSRVTSIDIDEDGNAIVQSGAKDGRVMGFGKRQRSDLRAGPTDNRDAYAYAGNDPLPY